MEDSKTHECPKYSKTDTTLLQTEGKEKTDATETIKESKAETSSFLHSSSSSSSPLTATLTSLRPYCFTQ